MIADVVIHNKKGNPHAHILLITREINITNDEKCHTLLQYMVEFQFKGAWCRSHADLDKLVASPTRNAIAQSCRTKNLDKRTMLAIVALWIVAQSGDGSKAINYTDYFLLGILKQPLTENFGKAVTDFMLEMYQGAG
ncbi:MobA/MobL family protein [Collimonas sp. OK607]|nr:MobA/MobL family protein [Collimonas sp. OK607]